MSVTPPPRQSSDAPTVIGPGSHIKGDMAFDNAARIEGTFEGTLSSKTELHIGEGGCVRANLDGATVVIDGDVEGDIIARECLQLNARAKVTGDIACATLVVVQGATFVGHCRVGPDALAPGNPPTPRGEPSPIRRPTVTADLEATLAGLESKLAGLGKTRIPATPTAGD